MKIIKAGYRFITPIMDYTYSMMLNTIASTARTCYKSEVNEFSIESDEKFIRNTLIARGHEAMLEHFDISVKFICDRGVSHELVRHRIASYAQESTRYCNYSKDKFGKIITFIQPCFFDDTFKNGKYVDREFEIWLNCMRGCEQAYFMLLDKGAKPEEARSVLPNSLKTEIVVKMNIREWRHFFKLRAVGTTGKPHPQMLEITVPLLKDFKEKFPVFFEDLEIKNDKN